MPSYYTKLWDHTDVAIMPLINGTALDAFGMMKGELVCAFISSLTYLFSTTAHHTSVAMSHIHVVQQAAAVAALWLVESHKAAARSTPC